MVLSASTVLATEDLSSYETALQDSENETSSAFDVQAKWLAFDLH